MLVVTTENIPGHAVRETLGHCFGLVVRSRGIGGNLAASVRSVFGGEIHEYTQMLEDSRRQAMDRMIDNARIMDANAVVMMRFDASEIAEFMTEIVAYGTAVYVDPPV